MANDIRLINKVELGKKRGTWQKGIMPK